MPQREFPFKGSFQENTAIFADRRSSDRQNLRKNEVKAMARCVLDDEFFHFNLECFITRNFAISA